MSSKFFTTSITLILIAAGQAQRVGRTNYQTEEESRRRSIQDLFRSWPTADRVNVGSVDEGFREALRMFPDQAESFSPFVTNIASGFLNGPDFGRALYRDEIFGFNVGSLARRGFVGDLLIALNSPPFAAPSSIEKFYALQNCFNNEGCWSALAQRPISYNESREEKQTCSEMTRKCFVCLRNCDKVHKSKESFGDGFYRAQLEEQRFFMARASGFETYDAMVDAEHSLAVNQFIAMHCYSCPIQQIRLRCYYEALKSVAEGEERVANSYVAQCRSLECIRNELILESGEFKSDCNVIKLWIHDQIESELDRCAKVEITEIYNANQLSRGSKDEMDFFVRHVNARYRPDLRPLRGVDLRPVQ